MRRLEAEEAEFLIEALRGLLTVYRKDIRRFHVSRLHTRRADAPAHQETSVLQRSKDFASDVNDVLYFTLREEPKR